MWATAAYFCGHYNLDFLDGETGVKEKCQWFFQSCGLKSESELSLEHGLLNCSCVREAWFSEQWPGTLAGGDEAVLQTFQISNCSLSFYVHPKF